ncbi:hypothetical protein BRADI_4g10457v3, partial [Brachypodium distachyon]
LARRRALESTHVEHRGEDVGPDEVVGEATRGAEAAGGQGGGAVEKLTGDPHVRSTSATRWPRPSTVSCPDPTPSLPRLLPSSSFCSRMAAITSPSRPSGCTAPPQRPRPYPQASSPTPSLFLLHPCSFPGFLPHRELLSLILPRILSVFSSDEPRPAAPACPRPRIRANMVSCSASFQDLHRVDVDSLQGRRAAQRLSSPSPA